MSQEEKGGRFQEEELEHICEASRRPRRGDGGWISRKGDTGYPWEDRLSNWEVEWEVKIKKRGSKSGFKEAFQGWVKGMFS